MKYSKIIEFADIKVSLLMVWKNLIKCLFLGTVFFLIGIGMTLNDGVDNLYSASSDLYCPVNGNYSETSSAIQIISSYATLIKSQKVAEKTVSILGNTELTARDIMGMISYSTSTSGINLAIVAYSYDPEEAVKVANAVASAYVEEIRNMTGMDVVQILNAADRASLSENGILSLWKKRIIYFGLGFILMAGGIFVLELFSDKIRSIDQCCINDDDVILGVISEIKTENEK